MNRCAARPRLPAPGLDRTIRRQLGAVVLREPSLSLSLTHPHARAAGARANAFDSSRQLHAQKL